MLNGQNPVLQNLRRLDQKFEGITEQMNDFQFRQTNGEKPDPNEFTRLLQKQSITNSAMSAQFNLLQKPLKAVLNDAK